MLPKTVHQPRSVVHVITKPKWIPFAISHGTRGMGMWKSTSGQGTSNNFIQAWPSGIIIWKKKTMIITHCIFVNFAPSDRVNLKHNCDLINYTRGLFINTHNSSHDWCWKSSYGLYMFCSLLLFYPLAPPPPSLSDLRGSDTLIHWDMRN